MTESTTTLFIPYRLRGIPLVSGGNGDGRHKNEDYKKRTETTTATLYQNTMQPFGKSPKLIQVGKRNIDMITEERSRQITDETGILFNPSAITAPTANIVKNKVIAINKQQSPTQRSRYKSANISGKANSKTPKPATTIKTTTTTKKPILEKILKPLESIVRVQAEPKKTSNKLDSLIITTTEQISTDMKMDKVEVVQETRMTSAPAPNLTRATQTLITQPGYQRRTSQTVLSPRFTNRPNGDGRGQFAGENWVLFNRPDGSFSVFEILVLISSMMIISTIIFVILYTWIKSLRKKHNPQEKQFLASETLTLVSRSPSNRQYFDDVSDQTNSRLSSATTATAREAQEFVAPTQQKQTSRQYQEFTHQKELAAKIESNAKDIVEKIDTSNQISNQLKSGTSLVNKAMVISEPSENKVKTSSSVFSDSEKVSSALKDELGKMQRPINRSVSELSGSPKSKQVQMQVQEQIRPNDTICQAADSTGETNRVATLNELFNGSAPNLSNSGATSQSKLDELSNAKANQKEELESRSRISASSLDSIELPDTLIDSIKCPNPRNPANVDPPSSNLLLDGLEKSTADNSIASSSLNVEEKVKEKPNDVSQQVVMADKENKKGNSKDNRARGTSKEKIGKKVDNVATADSIRHASTKTNGDVPSSKINNCKEGKEQPEFISAETERPDNPMAKQIEDGPQTKMKKELEGAKDLEGSDTAKVKNHQVVVNRLDKRKTNLEIVDLRDESVTGKMRNGKTNQEGKAKSIEDDSAGWISMDGVAVIQPAAAIGASIPTTNVPKMPIATTGQSVAGPQHHTQAMSPSDIIGSRFHVDYGAKKRAAKLEQIDGNKDSMDSKAEEYILNNIENELEQDNKMRNRKYFVYIVNDGHFTAKKECIARIELPPKRRITLAELRQLIANSQDISLSSLRRNRFKFVTETYRLLNENEDAAVLHQVYPTQGVFLKLNIPEQESQVYPFKGRARLSSTSGATTSSLSHTTIASRRRANVRSGRNDQTNQDTLPAIEVDYAQTENDDAPKYGRTKALGVGRKVVTASRSKPSPQKGPYKRSKSSVQTGRVGRAADSDNNKLPTIGRSPIESIKAAPKKFSRSNQFKVESNERPSLGSAATDLGANVLSGAKRLFNATFHR